jgi:hypothetical protein
MATLYNFLLSLVLQHGPAMNGHLSSPAQPLLMQELKTTKERRVRVIDFHLFKFL